MVCGSKRCEDEEEIREGLGSLLNLSHELVNTKIQLLALLLLSAAF